MLKCTVLRPHHNTERNLQTMVLDCTVPVFHPPKVRWLEECNGQQGGREYHPHHHLLECLPHQAKERQ